MSDFGLTLALGARSLTDAQVDALYRALPDATASERNECVYVGIDRAAPDLATAVVSAIEDVERALPGIRVLAIEPEELVHQAEIAQRRGRTRESISQLVKGERGPGTFPRPAQTVGGRDLWRWHEVERWFDDYEGRETQVRHDAFITAVNAALAARRTWASLSREEREAVGKLAQDPAMRSEPVAR